MSLLSNPIVGNDFIAGHHAGKFVLSVQNALLRVVLKFTSRWQLRLAADNRSFAEREIAALPVFLRDDVALSFDFNHHDQ